MPTKTTAARRRATRDEIARAALRLADAEGLGAVTMRRLGAELGVDPVIVYRHFDGKDDVLEAAADLVLADVRSPADGGDWRDDIRGGCRALRHALLDHPALAPLVVQRPPSGSHHFEATERLLAALRRAGLDDDDAAKAYHALVLFTLGSAFLETGLAELSPDQREERGRNARLMFESLPASQYPNATALAPRMFRSPNDNYEFGLDAMLDGIDQRTKRGGDTAR